MEAGGSQLPTPYPRYGTLVAAHLLVPFRLRGFHPLWRTFPGRFDSRDRGGRLHHNSTSTHSFPWEFGLVSSPFTRRYSGSLVLISFPHPTWMLPFGRFPLHRSRRWSDASHRSGQHQEIPFGHPRINTCMRLPGAYRSLPRPSSAPEPSYPPAGVFWPKASSRPVGDASILWARSSRVLGYSLPHRAATAWMEAVIILRQYIRCYWLLINMCMRLGEGDISIMRLLIIWYAV